MPESSGAQWCARFPTSTDLADLVEPFRSNATAFIAALRGSGALVAIAATYRPAERAYLMHWCCLVAGFRDAQKIFHQIAPGHVPAMPGIDIDWSCGGSVGAATAAAVAMREAYGIVFPAALVSRHTQRLAVDMTISFAGELDVPNSGGGVHHITSQQDLWPIGATYGVHKLASDPPHWSSDGH